jgi:L-seryl-tRNA(Ser) seleniumtransferase
MDPGSLEGIGVHPVINACGIYTDFGGSRLSPSVWEAMTALNRHFVRLPELLDRTGERVAALLGAEAARITPGAAAAIMLGTAACMAGTDGANSALLPDTRGMKNEVLIQAGHRYKYDRQVSMTGAHLIEVGDEEGTEAKQLVDAITPATAMILHPAHLDDVPGGQPLEAVAEIARAHGVPVFVDAAYLNFPVELMSSFFSRGANLVAYSAKYFGGPNAGGFVMGDAEMVAAVSNVHFTRYETGEYLKYGRPLKMDRQTIIAVLVALEEWLAMDHTARFAKYREQVDALAAVLSDIEGVQLEAQCFTMDERFVSEPVNCLTIDFDPKRTDRSAADVAAKLAAENPAIETIVEDDRIGVVMDLLNDDEVAHIGARLRHALARS